MNVKQSCAAELTALAKCKAERGLAPRECYDGDYDGACDELEYVVKRCVSFAACARSARVVYDQRADRADRADANRDLQKCLGKHRALFECQKRVAVVAAKQEGSGDAVIR